jgi:hypothetical protein
MLDEAHEVLRPAILWCDQRTQAQCDYITQTVGKETLVAETANPVLTGFTAPKIIWARDNEPQVYERARMHLLPKDYIRFKLTGRIRDGGFRRFGHQPAERTAAPLEQRRTRMRCKFQSNICRACTKALKSAARYPASVLKRPA